MFAPADYCSTAARESVAIVAQALKVILVALSSRFLFKRLLYVDRVEARRSSVCRQG